MLQSIRRNKARLEAKSALIREVIKLPGVNKLGSAGVGRPEVYYMLNERQSLILLDTMKSGVEKDEWHDSLVDAFLAAKKKIDELERQQKQASRQVQIPQNQGIANDLIIIRGWLNVTLTRVPPEWFAVFEEMHNAFVRLSVFAIQLPPKATTDISVGQFWYKYVRDVLKYDITRVQTYFHQYPDHRGLREANMYPAEWLPAYRVWFIKVYVPKHFPGYLRSQGMIEKDIATILSAFGVPYLPPVKVTKQLKSPITQKQIGQTNVK